MNIIPEPRHTKLLAVLSIALLGVWCWLLFRAGCAGGVKDGSTGVPLRSMELERVAVPVLLAGVAAGLASISSLKHLPVAKRVLWAVRLILFGLPIAWVVGVQFELLALRICS